MEIFPDNANLLCLVPSAGDLSLAKLAGKGMVMVDTCNTARKFRRLLIEQIRQIAIEKGWNEENIKIFEGDCWQHLRNVWFGAVTKQLSKTLAEIL